jgi:hypothetical protein
VAVGGAEMYAVRYIKNFRENCSIGVVIKKIFLNLQ